MGLFTSEKLFLCDFCGKMFPDVSDRKNGGFKIRAEGTAYGLGESKYIICQQCYAEKKMTVEYRTRGQALNTSK